MLYTASQKYLLCKTFLFRFTASSLYCLQEPAENQNLMVRHLTRLYFLESCGSQGSVTFRNKVAKIILAETNIETFNTFIIYETSFKHML